MVYLARILVDFWARMSYQRPMPEFDQTYLNYFRWLQDRGLTTPAPSLPADVSPSAAKQVPLLFILPSALQESPDPAHDELGLFNKMLQAMKLDPSTYQVVILDRDADSAILSSLSCILLVGMGLESNGVENGLWHIPEGAPVQCRQALFTFHPSELLQNPALKRQTWAHLQLVMEELKLLTP